MKKCRIYLSIQAKDPQMASAFDKINELGSMCKESPNTKCTLTRRSNGEWRKEQDIGLLLPP